MIDFFFAVPAVVVPVEDFADCARAGDAGVAVNDHGQENPHEQSSRYF